MSRAPWPGWNRCKTRMADGVKAVPPMPITPRPAVARDAVANCVGLAGALVGRHVDFISDVRGINYLLRHQREDGSWEEIRQTGTGFSACLHLRYHWYCQYFPLWALAMYRNIRTRVKRGLTNCAWLPSRPGFVLVGTPSTCFVALRGSVDYGVPIDSRRTFCRDAVGMPGRATHAARG